MSQGRASQARQERWKRRRDWEIELGPGGERKAAPNSLGGSWLVERRDGHTAAAEGAAASVGALGEVVRLFFPHIRIPTIALQIGVSAGPWGCARVQFGPAQRYIAAKIQLR